MGLHLKRFVCSRELRGRRERIIDKLVNVEAYDQMSLFKKWGGNSVMKRRQSPI